MKKSAPHGVLNRLAPLLPEMREWMRLPAAVILILAFAAGVQASSSGRSNVRVWSNRGSDEGSVHAMGNGKMVAYGQGPNLVFLYGPPYSTSNILSLSTESNQAVTDEATRESGSAIWRHTATADGKPALEFTEFVASDVPAYVRLVRCESDGIRWVLRPSSLGGFTKCASVPGAWQQSIRAGQRIFSYPSNLESFHIILPQGACSAELGANGELIVRYAPGEGSLCIVGAADYPDAVRTAERIAKDGAASLLEPTRKYWKSFTQRRLKTRPELMKIEPKAAEALDSTAVLIKSQQSDTGGEMAGPVFPLAYIRDQYGVARGMLALGMHDEARANLLFRFAKFQRFGSLLTAEAMGTDCARHQHENDEVEGPAYTILQARDYIRATGDNALGRKLWPMLDWCWNVQQKHAARGLLPFNGDETYVAGGFYPRSGLNQGSADTTLVYIESGKWLAEWAVSHKLWTEQFAREQLKRVAIARAAYRKHFWDKDRIWANAPEREQMTEAPRFRHGVCEGVCGWFGWNERNANGRYLCPSCLGTKDLPNEHPARMEVNSVSLLPAYLGSDILSPSETRAMLDHVLAGASKSGHIASVPGTSGCVGYDPGLILLNLTKTSHPSAKNACDRVLRMLDSAGAWNEYYDAEDHVRQGCCRARPWESGINAEAVIGYLLGSKLTARE